MSGGVRKIPAAGRALALARIKAPTFGQGPSGCTAIAMLRINQGGQRAAVKTGWKK